MLSLIKIRLKYIIRHPCLLFWTYIFLPAIILIAAIIVLTNKSDYKLEKYEKEALPDSTRYFLNNTFENLQKLSYLNFTAFLVDNEDNCNKIIEVFNANKIFIPHDYEQYVFCNTSESNLSNLTLNIIKIKKKDGIYRADIKCRTGSESEFLKIYGTNAKLGDFILYQDKDLKEDVITDAFYVYQRNKTDNITKLNLFFELQALISKIIIKLDNKKEEKSFKMSFGYNKYPDSYRFADPGQNFMDSLVCLLVTLQFALITYNVNMRMIDEKENKLNSLLERQGISKFKYMLSWLFTFFAFSFVSIVAFILLLIGTTNGHIYLLIINILLYALNLFTVCVFFTVCIKTVKTGATAIKFYNFGSLFLGSVLVLQSTLKVTKVIFSFIPHINFFLAYLSTYCLGNFDDLSFDLLLLRAAKTSYIESIGMYLVNIVFYLGLSIIIQSYKDSGLSFCSYLKSFCSKVSRDVNIINPINKDEESLNKEDNPMFEKHFQELSEINKQKLEQNQCLKLVNVSKSFDDLKAVDCFNGELFSNEIFCLLGHNGAGKTTTINMISGIFDPDEGDILLDGRSLVTDKKYLYENIGLCQQEDIFFDYLTVEEHLEYMCKIKGSQVNHQEIDELITKIDLLPKKKALCSTLSGGQKRKLCIALALIGNSRIILLDEPTSGMDVMARRSLWEFLKNYKKNKIILLTTHFLDEAEYLGDRIGIMTDGQYVCCGSSSFLKSKYPCGFNINLLINSNIFNENYKVHFYNEILNYEPKAEIKVASKGIFSINIQSNNPNIKEIFDYIEKSKNDFGIEDFTVASTSLEDVFLSINNKANLGDQKYSEKNEFSDMLGGIIPQKSDFCTQLCAQISRGFYPFYRNKTLFFFELLSGLGFVYIFIFFFSDSIRSVGIKRLNLIEVLDAHKIYINGIEKEFFEDSDTYDSYGTYITLSKLEGNFMSISDFMDKAYDNAFVHIAKGALSVNKIDENNIVYNVYNTETNNQLFGYFYANTMLFFSAFLKKEYGIKATIFPEIEFNPVFSELAQSFNVIMESFLLISVCLINFFGFVIFLGGLMLEKIKEKRTNIKHLLYLSGSNIFSYWIGFYIVDYLKLLIFSILLILPVYTVSDCATYFGYDMLVINISTLSFIYFISFFCSKDDEGTKILFLFFFGFIIVIILLIVAFPDEVSDYILNFTEAYKPTFFDMTPVTSMILSFIRIIISHSMFSGIDELAPDNNVNDLSGIKRPEIYLYTSYICQLINIVFYTLLLILAESGLLGKLIHCINLKCSSDADINIASMASIAPDDNIDNNIITQNNNINNVETPLINKSSNIIPLNNNNIINTNQYNSNQFNQTQNLSFPNKTQQNSDLNINPQNLKENPLQNPYVEEEIRKVYS